MSKAAYAHTRCHYCGRTISVAGLAKYNHLVAHFRRTFKGKQPVPNTVAALERSLHGRLVAI